MRVFAKGFWGASASSVSIFSSLFIVSLLLVPFNPSAQAVDDLMELSLQDLLDVDVTSVSKKSERRSEAAAAIYVISNEDIRRSTATSIPDLLRTVPGVNVAQIDSHTWSVTVRGQAGEFATKLLVLVDGRSVYTPLFSGVFWDTIDLVLEDVDRIEVVRGPGGTIWGSNAVNGVINIVTKTAEETQGGLISVAAGTTLDGSLSLRYGDSIGDDHFYRIYTKGIKYDDSGDDLFGENANDNWEQGRGGFRYDHDIDDQQHLTIQADYYSLTSNSDYFIPEVAPPPDFTRTAVTNVHTGFNALGRWTNKYSDTGEVSIQSFFDMYHTDSSVLDERRKTIDLEFEHQVQMHEKHNLIWGLGYRYSEDHITPVSTFRTVPASDTQGIVSFFIQDEYRINDELRLTMGTKVEHNDYTDFEIQPTLRASWLASETQTLWAGKSVV